MLRPLPRISSFFLLLSAWSIHLRSFQILSLVLAIAVFLVGPRNKTVHHAHCRKRVKQVPVVSTSQNINRYQNMCYCGLINGWFLTLYHGIRQSCDAVTCVWNWCERILNGSFVKRWPFAAGWSDIKIQELSNSHSLHALLSRSRSIFWYILLAFVYVCNIKARWLTVCFI